jgi:hypothetical protein
MFAIDSNVKIFSDYNKLDFLVGFVHKCVKETKIIAWGPTVESS